MLDSYDWLVFTSQTTVEFVLGRMPRRCFPPKLHPKIVAVGPATARAIEAASGRVALRPAESRQEGLAAALGGLAAATRVLLPIAAGGRALLPEALRDRGCAVDVVPVYRTQPVADLPEPPPFDAATFASPSALRAYLSGAGGASLRGKIVAVIGPTTATEAAAHGISATVAVSPHIHALISAIATARQSQGDP